VRLSPLGTAAYCTAPDDRWWWLWSNWWNEDWQGKPKYSEKTCPSATLSTTNPTWRDPGSNPARRDRKPETNRLSYGTVLVLWIRWRTIPLKFLSDHLSACYPMSTGDLFPGVKRPGRESDQSSLSSAKVKNGKLYLFCPTRLHGMVLN
jgi:hypothetical protein